MQSERKSTEARREEIIRVALKIVSEDGIHALTLREISVRIGISEAAIFRHFENKEGIINSLAGWVFKEYIVEEMGSDKGVREGIAGLMKRQFLKFQQFPAVTSVLFQEEIFREFPQAKQIFDERRKERANRVASMIRTAKIEGEIAQEVNEEIFSLIFMGTMRMAVLEWRDANFTYDLAAQEEAIMHELVKMLPSPGFDGLKGRN
jgi:AcrR family transcriptional regulator